MPITLRQNRRFSYLYVNDLMPILDYFITHEVEYKSYNITPDEETELLTAAKTVLDVAGKKLPIQVATPGYGLNYSGSNARLKKEMPHVQFTPLAKSIDEMTQYYRQNQFRLDTNLLQRDK